MNSKKARGNKPVKVQLELQELADLEAPHLEITRIDAKGNRHPVEIDGDRVFELDRRHSDDGSRLEVRSREHGEARLFRYESVLEAVNNGRWRLSPSVWRCWIGLWTCVGGSVEVCRSLIPRPIDVIADLEFGLRDSLRDLVRNTQDSRLFLPFRCSPVCHGKVEVYLRTCCCYPIVIDPPIIIRDLCEIIDCPVPPWPIPPRIPPLRLREEILADTEKALLKARQRRDGSEDRIVEAARHLTALMDADSVGEQKRYIEAYPALLHRFCQCSTRKVGETFLQPGGDFNHCFVRWPLFTPNCNYKVAYRVSQIQDGQWVTIYDGLAKNAFFGLNESAELRASLDAESCDTPPWPNPDGIQPFVALEQVGNTWADVLIHSTDQNGETSFAGPLQAADGLAVEAPPGGNPKTQLFEQPWATTLRLRFQFHPGLEDLGARYFRVRVVRINSAGAALSERTHNADLSWRKYYDDGGQLKVRWVPLQVDPASVGGQEGLYQIPYFDEALPWLGGQWHAHINTLDTNADNTPKMPNGRYLFVVDLFDAAGNRMEPANAGGAHNFEFRRLDGPLDDALANTSVVAQKALANLFLVDNTPAQGAIQALKVNGTTPSSANCQFLEGSATDELAIQYQAQQTTGYQWRHWVRLKQGLSGPTHYVSDAAFVANSAAHPAALSDAEMSGGSGSLTAPMAFGALLGSEPRCAFAAELVVQTKHTNGMGRLSTYDIHDPAAFALLIGPGAAGP